MNNALFNYLTQVKKNNEIFNKHYKDTEFVPFSSLFETHDSIFNIHLEEEYQRELEKREKEAQEKAVIEMIEANLEDCLDTVVNDLLKDFL